MIYSWSVANGYEAEDLRIWNQVLFHVESCSTTLVTRTLRLCAVQCVCTHSSVRFPKSGSENFVSADVLIETDRRYVGLLADSPYVSYEAFFAVVLPTGRIHHFGLEIGAYRIVKSP